MYSFLSWWPNFQEIFHKKKIDAIIELSLKSVTSTDNLINYQVSVCQRGVCGSEWRWKVGKWVVGGADKENNSFSWYRERKHVPIKTHQRRLSENDSRITTPFAGGNCFATNPHMYRENKRGGIMERKGETKDSLHSKSNF